MGNVGGVSFRPRRKPRCVTARFASCPERLNRFDIRLSGRLPCLISQPSRKCPKAARGRTRSQTILVTAVINWLRSECLTTPWWTKNAFELGRCKQGNRTARADWQQQARNQRQSQSLKRDIRSPSISALGGLEQRWLCARFIYSGISIWFGAQPSLCRARRCARPMQLDQ